jgi:hypothetical protein
VRFDPELHVSPYRLFERLTEAAEGGVEAPLLVDVRPTAGGLCFDGAVRYEPGWQPPAGRQAVLVDLDGEAAIRLARELRRRGHSRVLALYGGLRLYDHALDPAVVGDGRFVSQPPRPQVSSST